MTSLLVSPSSLVLMGSVPHIKRHHFASRNIKHLGVYFRKRVSKLDELCETSIFDWRDLVLCQLMVQMLEMEGSIEDEGFHLDGSPIKIATGLYSILGLLMAYRIHVATRSERFKGRRVPGVGYIAGRLSRMLENMTGCQPNLGKITSDDMDYEVIIECRRLYEELEEILPLNTGTSQEWRSVNGTAAIDLTELRGLITRAFDDIGTSCSCATW